MVGRLGWYDSQYPVALSACLGGKGVRSEATVSRSRRELSNVYFLAIFGLDTAENEPSQVCPTVPVDWVMMVVNFSRLALDAGCGAGPRLPEDVRRRLHVLQRAGRPW